MRLGIDTFSLRSQGWTAFQIVDYAAGLELENVHFSERAHIGDIETSNLEAVREYANQRNLTLEIGMRSFNRLSPTFDPALGSGEQQLIDMVAAAEIVGSPIVRCFAGMQADRLVSGGFEAYFEESVRALKAAASHAEAAGIAIAVENHGGVDFLASELVELIEAVGSTHVRICLDTGNPPYAAEDAVYAADILAPYVVTCHLCDTHVWLTPDGAMAQWVPAGRGSLDIPRIASILKTHAPDVPLDIEEITGGAPKLIPIYDQDSEFWQLYPDMKAPALARFLATAQKKSEQFEPVSSATSPEVAQREYFEESVRFVKSALAGTEKQ